jgi:hypothetical protein
VRFARAARRLILATGLLAIGVVDAAADSVAVGFTGNLHYQSGGSGSIPFGGILFYDAAVPDSADDPGVNFYEFAPGSAGIRIETPIGTFQSDPASTGVFAVSLPMYVDENGTHTSPNDPDALLGALFWWVSNEANLPPSVDFVKLERLVAQHLPDGFALPTSAELLAETLLGATAQVDAGPELQLYGSVESATPIPEPATAALLGMGMTLLALGPSRLRRARRLSRGPRASPRRSRA